MHKHQYKDSESNLFLKVKRYCFYIGSINVFNSDFVPLELSPEQSCLPWALIWTVNMFLDVEMHACVEEKQCKQGQTIYLSMEKKNFAARRNVT